MCKFDLIIAKTQSRNFTVKIFFLHYLIYKCDKIHMHKIYYLIYFYFYFFIVVDFVIHWNETAMGLHVFPIPIPPPTSLSTRSL